MALSKSYSTWKSRRPRVNSTLPPAVPVPPKLPTFGGSVSDVFNSPQPPSAVPGYTPPAQPFGYPQAKPREGMPGVGPAIPSSPMASAPGEGFLPPGTSMSLKNDVMDFGEMPPGMQSQASSPFSTGTTGFTPKSLTEGTLDQVRGGKPASPFENTPGVQGPPVAPEGAAAITPGALAGTPGFDPRFMKPKAPIWR